MSEKSGNFDLKELHGVLLEILCEFDRICREHGLKYSLAWGTMLGAVRHGGFIPWDDDVDVIMERSDYDRFCELCKTELKEGFFFQTKESDKNYWYNVGRLRKNNTAMIYEDWKNAGFHLGLYIDIQPLDHIADNRFKRAVQYFFIILNTPVRMSRNPILFRAVGSRYGKALKAALWLFSKIIPKNAADRIETHFIKKYNGKPTRCEQVICDGGVLINTPSDMLPFPVKWYGDFYDIEFEGKKFMCSGHTDELLTLWYGDYMKLPPENQRVMTHFPLVFDTKRDYTEYLKSFKEKEENK